MNENKKVAYIVPLSGGLDSTYLVYRLLEEGKSVFAFHTSFKHMRENKWREELLSVQNMSDWFNERYDKFIIKYVHMDIREVGIGFDADQNMLIAQKLCYVLCTKPFIDEIILTPGVVSDDNSEINIKRRNYNGVGLSNLLWSALIDSMMFKYHHTYLDKINRTIYTPLYNDGVYKKDILKLIPEDLLEMVWYCRNPLPNSMVCGKCASCVLHKKAVEESRGT